MNLPDFNMHNLASAVESLSPAQMDDLDFGVIKLDAEGVVRVHNKNRTESSGRGAMPTVGLHFFTELAPCFDNGYFKGRIDKARVAGALNISFEFIGDFADRARELAVKAQAAKDGGTWLFIREA